MKNLFFTICPLMLLAAASNLHAQETAPQNKKWTFRTRIIMTDSSDQSDPKGYLVYSAFAVEPSISRQLTKVFSLELSARTESHEVDIAGDTETSEDIRLGSIELLGITAVS